MRRARHPGLLHHPARPQTLPLQIIPALAAALIANFTSFGLACGASFGIGILYSLLQYASTLSWFPTVQGNPLPGVSDLLAFLIIIGVLFWRGARIPGRGVVLERRLPEAPRPQHLWRSAAIFGLAAAVAAGGLPLRLPQRADQHADRHRDGAVPGGHHRLRRPDLGDPAQPGRRDGLHDVAHGGSFGITFPAAALIGIAVAVIIGVITAFSAVRVRGVSLAVVTLAGAVAIENFGFQNPTWGGSGSGTPVPEPKWFGLDLGPNGPFRGIDGNQPSPVFGWVVLICCVLLCVAVGYIRRGKLGQQMLAVRSNERAAAAASVNPRTVKLYAFTFAAFIAGVAGSLYAYNFSSVSGDRFDAVTALSLIAFAYAGGITLISGAVFAGLISAQGLSSTRCRTGSACPATGSCCSAGSSSSSPCCRTRAASPATSTADCTSESSPAAPEAKSAADRHGPRRPQGLHRPAGGAEDHAACRSASAACTRSARCRWKCARASWSA